MPRCISANKSAGMTRSLSQQDSAHRLGRDNRLTVLDGRGWARARRDVVLAPRDKSTAAKRRRTNGHHGAAQRLVHLARRSPGLRNDIDQDYRGSIDSPKISGVIVRTRTSCSFAACWRPGRLRPSHRSPPVSRCVLLNSALGWVVQVLSEANHEACNQDAAHPMPPVVRRQRRCGLCGRA